MSMVTVMRTWLVGATWVAAVGWAAGASAFDTVQQVEACLRDNLPSQTSVQTVSLRHVDRTGSKRTLEAKIFWKRSPEGLSRIRIGIEAPPDDRGSAYLLREVESGDPEGPSDPPKRSLWITLRARLQLRGRRSHAGRLGWSTIRDA
jgi:hypothetical protein